MRAFNLQERCWLWQLPRARCLSSPWRPLRGPRLNDLVGSDIGLHVGANFVSSFPDRVYVSRLIPALNEAKRPGEKTGKGFYKVRGQGGRLVRQGAGGGRGSITITTYGAGGRDRHRLGKEKAISIQGCRRELRCKHGFESVRCCANDGPRCGYCGGRGPSDGRPLRRGHTPASRQTRARKPPAVPPTSSVFMPQYRQTPSPHCVTCTLVPPPPLPSPVRPQDPQGLPRPRAGAPAGRLAPGGGPAAAGGQAARAVRPGHPGLHLLPG